MFSGGCFWGVQGVFQHVRGVRQVLSGYAGGERATAQYETVSSGHHRSRRIGPDHLQSRGDFLRPAAAGVFFRGARSHPAESAVSRRRHPIPLGNLLRGRSTEADCRGLYRAVEPFAILSGPHSHASRSPQGFLPCGGLSPGLSDALSNQPVHRSFRRAEGRKSQACRSRRCLQSGRYWRWPARGGDEQRMALRAAGYPDSGTQLCTRAYGEAGGGCGSYEY